LNNLKKPGLDVSEMFRLTGADVRHASGGEQIPAIYSRFFDVAYLETRPSAITPAPEVTPRAPAFTFQKGWRRKDDIPKNEVWI
jgi:hypothetical protein